MYYAVAACPGANLRITLQHCLQAKTRQIVHYNVNGLGQGFLIIILSPKQRAEFKNFSHFRSLANDE